MRFRCRVDHGDAAHDADKNPFGSIIIPKVVRISFLANCDTLAKSPRLAVINVHRAVSCVGHEELVEFGNVEYALRFVQPLDALNYLGLEGIDHLYGIVTQGGKNQQPTLGVRGEVIDAASYTRRRNSLNELQWKKFVGRRGSRGGGSARRCVAAKESKDREPEEALYRRACLHIFSSNQI